MACQLSCACASRACLPTLPRQREGQISCSRAVWADSSVPHHQGQLLCCPSEARAALLSAVASEVWGQLSHLQQAVISRREGIGGHLSPLAMPPHRRRCGASFPILMPLGQVILPQAGQQGRRVSHIHTTTWHARGGAPLSTVLGHQPGLRQQPRLETSLWPLVVAQASNTDPGYNRTTGPDMSLRGTMNPDVTMAPWVSRGHSDQFGPQQQHRPQMTFGGSTLAQTPAVVGPQTQIWPLAAAWTRASPRPWEIA